MAVFRDFYRNLGRIIFVSFLCVVSGMASASAYTLTYNCGDGTAVGTLPQQSIPVTGSLTLSSGDICTPQSGYEFYYWSCNTSSAANRTSLTYVAGAEAYFSSYNADVVCTAVYRTYCAGNPSLVPVGQHINAIEAIIEHPIDNSDGPIAGHNNGSVVYSYGTVGFVGMCSSTSGTKTGVVGTPAEDNTSKYCWCRMTSFTPTGGGATSYFSDSPWVYASASTSCTAATCTETCGTSYLDQSGSGALFRQSLYDMCPIKLSYSCGVNAGGTPPGDSYYAIGSTIVLEQGAPDCYSNNVQQFGGWNCRKRIQQSFPGGYTYSLVEPTLNNGFSLTIPESNVVCDVVWENVPLTLTYHCGNIPGTTTGVGGNAPSSVATTSYSSVTLASSAPNCNAPNGYQLIGWYCYGDGVVKGLSDEIFPLSDVDCYAAWAPVNPCAPGQFEGNYEVLGGIITESGWNSLETTTSVYSDVSVNGMCSETVGNYMGETGSPVSNAGAYCWCQLDGVTAAGANSSTPIDGYPWVYTGLNDENCSSASCESYCEGHLAGKHPYKYLFDNSLLRSPVCNYSVTFTAGDAGGVTPTGSTAGYSNKHNGEVITLPANGFNVPAGYIFNGWDCDNNIGNKAVNSTFAMPANNVVCEAQWIAQYTLTYDCQGRGTAPASVTAVGGTSVSLANGCSGELLADYDFEGWYCTGGAAGNIYNPQPNSPVNLTLEYNTTCYAIWMLNEPCDPGTTQETQILDGLINSENIDWESSNWSDISPMGASTVTLSFDYGDVEFEGMCSTTSGTIPGMPGNPAQTNAGDHCWCHVVGFAPSGYSMTPLNDFPWVYSGNMAPCATGGCNEWCTHYWQESHHSNAAMRSFFHHNAYTKYICEYSVNYDCEADGTTNYTSSATGGENVILVNNCTVPTGYTFDHWSCEEATTSSSISINDRQIVMPYDNVNCTAAWAALPRYNVTFAPGDSNNDGTGTSATGSTTGYSNKLAGEVITLPANGFSAPSGYGFNGWNCNQNIGNKAAGTTFTMPSNNVTCTAQWTPNTNPIIYKCGILNNDATAHDTTYVASGATQDLTNIEPVYCTDASTLGYTFSHWKCCYTNANTLQGNVGTTQNCPANTGSSLWSIVPSGWVGTVCEAQWTQAPTTYTVTYHGGSCNASVSALFYDTVNAGSSYTIKNPQCDASGLTSLVPAANDTCVSFEGWSTSSSSNQVDYTCNQSCANNSAGSCGTLNVSSNVDLYAVCQEIPHDVIYHGGSCDSNSAHDWTHNDVLSINSRAYTVLTLANLSSLGSSLVIPSHSFQGWAPAADYQNVNWCKLTPDDLYPELYGGNGKSGVFQYNRRTDKTCRDVDLYAVCCPLNLTWVLNDGSWPVDPNNNNATLANPNMCEWGVNAGNSGSIMPLRTPVKTGYTFDGWKVTGWTTQ